MQNVPDDDVPIRDLTAELGKESQTDKESRIDSGPEKGPPSTDRRRSARMIVQLPVTVRVMVEEQTFSPFTFEGTCENISRSGALATVSDLSPETCHLLIQRPRYVRMTCKPPGLEKTLNLFGKLVWFDRTQTPPYSVCKIGINFEPMSDDAVAELEEFLDTAADGIPPDA